jgi:hypothetical protein
MPRVNDGALLFLQTMLAKMVTPADGGSRIAIIFNGSPLSNGDCDSGESEIRRWILENDWLDAIVMLPDQMFYNTGIFTYIWLLRNDKPASHRGRVMLIDARQQFEKEPKSFGNKRNRITDEHRAWIEERYRDGWAKGYADEQVKIFRREDFAYHKVSVVFWQSDENDKPATISEPYEKAFTAANVKKELEFYESELTFLVRVKADGEDKTIEISLKPGDDAAKKFKAAFEADQKSFPSIGRIGTMCRTTNISPMVRTLKRSWNEKLPSQSSVGRTPRKTASPYSATKSSRTNTSTATSRPRLRKSYWPSSGSWKRRRRRCLTGWQGDIRSSQRTLDRRTSC